MTYLANCDLWGTRGHSVVTLAPSRDDLFVVTTVLGRTVFVQPITDYDNAVRRAQAFARRIVHPRPVVIKIFCLTLPEAQAMGFVPNGVFAGADQAEMRLAMIAACNDAVRNSNDPTVRVDALNLLQHLKVTP